MSSARTPLMVPPRRTAKGWHRYEVMIRSFPSMADSIPMATASYSSRPTRKRSRIDWDSVGGSLRERVRGRKGGRSKGGKRREG
jgi:hypothetical protein